MSSREIRRLEAAVDAGEAADLGEFCDIIRYNRRYVWLTIFLTVTGWFFAVLTVVAMYLAKTRDGQSAPAAEYLFLIGFAALALGGPFGIRSTGRDARARVYLFDDGLVHTDKWGESATVAWRDVVIIQRTSVLGRYTSREVGRRYALLTASGGGVLRRRVVVLA